MRLVFLLATIFSTSFQIPAPIPEITVVANATQRFVRQEDVNSDPCLDTSPVETPHFIELPQRYSKIVDRPWIWSGVPTKLFKSYGVTYQWAWMKALIVRGLKDTIGDLLQKKQPVFLAGEVSCDMHVLYQACVDRYGPSPCALYPLENGNYRMEIGDAAYNGSIDTVCADPIVFHEWGTMLNVSNLNNLSYTVDVMGILEDGIGDVYLIDGTGRGLKDLCMMKISAAVDDRQVEAWSAQSLWKNLRFFELRALEFTLFPGNLNKEVKANIKKMYDKKTVQTYYCEAVLRGVLEWSEGPSATVCHVVYPDNDRRRFVSRSRTMIREGLGNFWKEQVAQDIDGLEAMYLTPKQFVETRNRLLNRTANVETLRITAKQIVHDKPMVEDISEVHKRPIMGKSEAPTELPPDFPSAPKASPNKELKFQEPPSFEFQNPVAYEELLEEPMPAADVSDYVNDPMIVVNGELLHSATASAPLINEFIEEKSNEPMFHIPKFPCTPLATYPNLYE
ncbi:unnamed protein product [Caenorhabditis auriculariae]|uniref:Uncharacterized protein n=1 Tax=Caenorhabditis auriculariae TaxID=2777116 RepID=A0A8S1HMU0_9PELO|nr:unnamed protein product [Caenorhabditis auriculariae]